MVGFIIYSPGMGLVAVTGFAAYPVAVFPRYGDTLPIFGQAHIAAAGHVVALGPMTGSALEIKALAVHVHVHLTLGVDQRSVQITMLNAVAACAKKVTTATVTAGRQANIPCNVGKIRSFPSSLVARVNGRKVAFLACHPI